MKIVNTLKKGVIASGILAAIFLFVRSQTDGFSESKIYREKNLPSQWNDPESRHFPILKQRFSYLGHGTQSFALISEDGKYVLKFFRNDRASHPLQALSFLLPPFARARLEKTLEKREIRRLKSFASYQIAFEKLRVETGLLDLHLNGSLNQIHTFTDKIGVIHHLQLSNVPFLLQRRADPLYPTLLSWIQEGELDRAKQSLSELAQILKSRCEKGIFDKDANLKTNFGWIDRHPIQTDVGRFSLDEKRKDPQIYRNDLIRITDRLCKWLENHAPQLAQHLRQEVEAL